MIYHQSIQYREENASRYGLGPNCLCDPWLASPKLLNLMQAQVEVVESVLAQFPQIAQDQLQNSMSLDGPSYLRESPAHLLSALREDLCDLVDCTLGAYQQRALFLQR
jgi:hypothetical protein